MKLSLVLKFVTLLVVVFFCNIAFADKYFQNSIDILHKKMNSVNSFDYVFYISEISYAAAKPKNITLNCYRKLMNNQSKYLYDTDIDCIKFRAIYGKNNDQFIKIFSKLQEIVIDCIHKEQAGFFNNLVKDKRNKYYEDFDKIDGFIQITVKVIKLAKNSK